MFKIQIPRSYLAAAARFAATKDIRYYLNAVCVEVHANVAYIVGTDGHILGAGRIVRDKNSMMEGQGQALIPIDIIGKIKAKGNNGMEIVLTVSDDGKFTLNDCGTETAGACVQGRFPDWRRVVPSKVSGAPSQFDPALLARCSKAAQDLGSKKGLISIGHNGNDGSESGYEGAAVVDIGNPAFVAVVMPVRGEAPPKVSPGWTSENASELGRLSLEDAHNDAIEAGRLDLAEALADAFPDSPLAVVGADIADAFGMRGLPNTLVLERIAA